MKVIQKSISIPCNVQYLQDARNMVMETLLETSLSERDRNLVIIAVDEAITAIVIYGGENHLENDVMITIDIDDVRFKATINDSINSFDFNGGMTDAQFDQRVKKERQHKLGIFLIRAIMDEITYSYKKGFENQLELIRFL